MARQSEGAWYRKAKDAWYATISGQQLSLGVRGKANRKAAQEAWHKLMVDWPGMKPEPKTEALTVKQVVDSFLSDVAGRAKTKTVEVYRYLLTPFVEKMGGRAASDVRPHDAEEFARKPSWSSSTRNDFLTALVTAFRWATRAGLLTADPLSSVRKPPKTSRGTKAVITADDFHRLHDSASASFKPFVMGLWLTGCRPGELARLTAQDVNTENRVAILSEHKTADKTGRARFIFLSPEAVGLFKRQANRHPSGPLFRNKRGGQWTGWAIVKAMEAAREKSGLPHAIAYGMRHSYATEALASGIPDTTVAALLGHTGTAILHKHYSHLTSRADVLRQAAAKVRG
jgi:integrase